MISRKTPLRGVKETASELFVTYRGDRLPVLEARYRYRVDEYLDPRFDPTESRWLKHAEALKAGRAVWKDLQGAYRAVFKVELINASIASLHVKIKETEPL